MNRRYLIVGSGAAGIGAAEAIRSRDPHGQILLLCEERDGYYSRPGLAYYLTGELPEDQLYPFSTTDFQRLRLERRTARVIALQPDTRTLLLEEGEQLNYDCLLLATGAAALPVRLPGIEARGVVKLDNIEDARQIIAYCRRARRAVVIGGGITALELVEGLRSQRIQVDYLLRGDRYWSNVLDEYESRIVEGRLKEEGVKIHHHTDLAAVEARNGRIQAVTTKDGRSLPCDLLAVAIGVAPRKHLAVQAGLRCDRGVLVDEYLQSSAQDIFAAGDVAQVFDPAAGRAILDSLWNPARQQGFTAGLNMTGDHRVYIKGMPFNVTRLAGLTTTIIGTVGAGSDADLTGIARGDSETWRQLPDSIAAQAGFQVNRLRIQLGENTLLGAVLMGDQSLSRPLQRLVSEQVDIRPIRDQLLQPNAPVASLIADFWASYQRSLPA